MEFVSHQLQDGMKLWVWPTPKFKNVSIKIVLHRHLADNTAASALLPFVNARGTEQWGTTREIALRMADLYGTRHGSDVMKIGEQQLITTEVLTVNPKYVSEPGLLAAALSMAAQLAFYPRMERGQFIDEYLDQEKALMRQRIAAVINDKRGYAHQRFNEAMYATEAASRYKYGTIEELEVVTSSSLTEHWQRVRGTAPINVFVVGDIQADEVVDLLLPLLPPRTGTTESIPPAVVKSTVAEVKEVIEHQPINQAILLLGYRTGITVADPLYFAALVANGILGGFPHSKLFVNVREKASLAYYASSNLNTTKGTLVATAGIDPQNYRRAVEIITDQVVSLQGGEITEAELSATKKGLINQLKSAGDSAGLVIDRTVAGIVRGKILSIDEMVRGIESVTKDEAVAAAQRFLLDTVYCLTNQEGREKGENINPQ